MAWLPAVRCRFRIERGSRSTALRRDTGVSRRDCPADSCWPAGAALIVLTQFASDERAT